MIDQFEVWRTVRRLPKPERIPYLLSLGLTQDQAISYLNFVESRKEKNNAN